MSKKNFFVIFAILLVFAGALALLLLMPIPSQVLPAPTVLPTPTAQPGVSYRLVDPNNPDLAAIEQRMQFLHIVFNSTFQQLDVNGTLYRTLTKTVISKGQETLQAYSYKEQGVDVIADAILVYEWSPLAVLEYPLVVGILDEQNGVYYPFYTGYQAQGETDCYQQRKMYLAYLEEQQFLERGHVLWPGFSSNADDGGSYDGFLVDPLGIDWGNSAMDKFFGIQGGAPRNLGQWMQEQFHLDLDVISDTLNPNRIPDGWMLVWPWDAATTQNSDPLIMKVELPE